jgi:hypothetical protein
MLASYRSVLTNDGGSMLRVDILVSSPIYRIGLVQTLTDAGIEVVATGTSAGEKASADVVLVDADVLRQASSDDIVDAVRTVAAGARVTTRDWDTARTTHGDERPTRAAGRPWVASVGVHVLTKRPGTHVGPRLVHIGTALVPRAGGALRSPAGGHVQVGGPQ